MGIHAQEKHAYIEGKSFNFNLNFRLNNNIFRDDKLSTIGFDINKIYYELIDGTVVTIKIIDTAGQERCRSQIKSLYSRVDACILVYDVTNRASFENCNIFISIIEEMCKKDILVMLLGNKCDLENYREVTEEEGSKFSKLHGFLFYEISCKENINVFQSFSKLFEICESKLEDYDKNIVTLRKKHIKKDRKKCC